VGELLRHELGVEFGPNSNSKMVSESMLAVVIKPYQASHYRTIIKPHACWASPSQLLDIPLDW